MLKKIALRLANILPIQRRLLASDIKVTGFWLYERGED